MGEPRTVIERFVSQVTAELTARGAGGAAQSVFSSAATLEPSGRSQQIAPEHQRLLMLADRAARHWAPAATTTQRDARLESFAVDWPRIAEPADAADAAVRVGALRAALSEHRAGPGAVAPTDIAAALVPIQVALRHVGQSADDPLATAVVAVPQFAKGLVEIFMAGVGFSPDGIPGETAATVTILDALDDRRTRTHGTSGMERTAAEGDLHRALVRLLMSRLAQGSGEITHADDGALPEPPKIGRHRPDIVGRDIGDGLFIGEAKTGPEFFHAHTQEQLEDFSTHRLDGERVAFHLMVPGGWRDEAEHAIRQAGGEVDHFVVIHEVGGIPGAPTPPSRASE